jgi:glycerol-3-phosphate dehydrogenase
MTADRASELGRLDDTFDVLVIGGGATGVGAALDAVSRGYKTALVEASDFAKATSSRSTKLIHGGVRYLQNGELGLVRESLHERANLLRNASHLVTELGFLCPAYRCYEGPLFFAGFTAYDMLAGFSNFPRSRPIGRAEALRRSPDLKAAGLYGGIRYFDGQFDDARLALAIARTAADRGATVLNYVRALRFLYENGRARGAVVRDEETGNEIETRAKVVVNATGIFVDELRSLDEPGVSPLLSHSRGSHVVFPAHAYRGNDALLVPKTDDGRVLFVIPWQGSIVIGTTDVPVDGTELDVKPTNEEIEFIIGQANKYLKTPVARKDALATYAGLRPLVSGKASSTAKLSREHLVDISPTGLVTVTGGKWTTYRKMAEDTIDVAAREGKLALSPSPTARLGLHGNPPRRTPRDAKYAAYGTDAEALRALEREEPALAEPLDAQVPLTGAQVAFAAREEAARTVDDVLARRTRTLFVNVEAALRAAPRVASLLARELGRDEGWQTAQLAGFARIAADVAPNHVSAR